MRYISEKTLSTGDRVNYHIDNGKDINFLLQFRFRIAMGKRIVSMKYKRQEMQFSTVILCCLLCFAAPDRAGAQNRNEKTPIGPEAIFHPGKDFLQTFHSRCDSLAYPKFGECFVSAMKSSGASPQAIAFAHLLDNSGYMRDFSRHGKGGCRLCYLSVQGERKRGVLSGKREPSLVDVDELLALPQNELKKDRHYNQDSQEISQSQSLAGERYRTVFPESSKLPRGIQRFTVTYWLKDGCHACQDLGLVLYAFVFRFHRQISGKDVPESCADKDEKMIRAASSLFLSSLV